MVYKRPRKILRGTVPPEKYTEACEIVIKQGKSVRSVALPAELMNNLSPSAPSTSYQILPQTSAQPTPSLSNHTSPRRTSLVDLVPLPKAPPRVKSKTGRSKGKSAIYTDTPEKEALEAKQRKINEKKMPKLRNFESKPTGKKLKNTVRSENTETEEDINEDTDDADADDNYCIVCFEHYKTSREDWLQCRDCHKWAHSSCANNDPYFVCLNCLSE